MKHTLSGIIQKGKPFGEVLANIRGGQLPCSALNVTHNAKPFFVDSLAHAADQTIICITSTDQAARDYAAALGDHAVFFPERDISLRNVEAKSRESEMDRIRVLKHASEQKLVFLSVRSAMMRMLPRKIFESFCLTLTVGENYGMQPLLQALVHSGYERTGTVYSKGEYAKRGEILDVFPSDSAGPIRITFFDDEIESIRRFELETQKSTKKHLQEYLLPPATEVLLTEHAQEQARNYFTQQPPELESVSQEILFELEEYGSFEIADTFLPILYESTTVFDYFPGALYVYDDFERISAEAHRMLTEFEDAHARLARGFEAFPAQKETLLSLRVVTEGKEGSTINLAGISSGDMKLSGEVDMGMRAAVGFNGRIEQLAKSIRDRQEHGYAVYLFAGAKAESLSDTLAELDIFAPILREDLKDTKLGISRDNVSYGFEMESPRALVLGINDIFGRIKRTVRSRRKESPTEDIFSDLKPGDFIVHDVHGKGKYVGLTTMEAGGNRAEYMELEYRGGDRLYIPTAQIDRVQKYIGSESGHTQLSKLGGKEWENAKARVRESTLKLAFDLVDLYASRYEHNGFAFSADTVWQRQFEDTFDFEETEGQLESAIEIKKDMESPRVMDRLLLGDVGYGKTEVAMRAAMKAVMDGKQVAVLVPTTLLARQHTQTFRDRFKDFPVTIKGLTRFSRSTHKQILQDLSRGKVDIVIGTHRLLSNDVKFNDLGLLIVDEEQRFGVNHKEKIKVMKETVDVLTLSATPIPRTLEMSLTGVRDMSTIDTPPPMRVEPHTYVMRYSDGLLRDAIVREMDSGGQVYFVCRQIQQMDRLIGDVKKNVPEARVAAAHGQMAESEIEHVVSGFIEGEYDVLVCTTIIESGIDIPAVNTIIVYEADKFGLSQLYQLKGRVGRADKASYAYFTYLGDGVMNENAAKRLEAIKEFTQLGSGYKIAMRDLQIRGAGNLLGAEQSGHMASVGYSMYVKLMKEAVELARGKEQEPEYETSVELNLPAFIPNSYISEQTDKMDIYRLISKIKSLSDAEATTLEIADRYGALPTEVENLVLAAVVKEYAARAGLASVIRKKNNMELKLADNVQPDTDRLVQMMGEHGDRMVLRDSTPPVILYRLPGEKPTKALVGFLQELSSEG